MIVFRWSIYSFDLIESQQLQKRTWPRTRNCIEQLPPSIEHFYDKLSFAGSAVVKYDFARSSSIH